MRLEIIGNIASGKTTLACLLEDRFKGTFENFKENPFWESFYETPEIWHAPGGRRRPLGAAGTASGRQSAADRLPRVRVVVGSKRAPHRPESVRRVPRPRIAYQIEQKGLRL